MRERLSCLLIDRFADVYRIFNPITPTDTGRITDSIFAVKTGQVNFYIYRRGSSAICIDTGFGRWVIRRELARLGISPQSIDSVFLTHSDFDHAGGMNVFGHSRVYLSRQEEQMIDGSRSRRFGVVYNRLASDSYELLDDGDVIAVGPIKVRAISTPGHTAGSMSYLVEDRYLFVGDALRIIDGKARTIHPILTMSVEDEARSIRKLAALPGIEMLLTAHRGCWSNFVTIMEGYRD